MGVYCAGSGKTMEANGMKKLLFIYNAQAGKGQVNAHLAEMLDAFVKAHWRVTVHPTQGPGDAAATAAELGSAFDRVVCCGGDGTLHEVVNGLMQLRKRPVLGYVPSGSTNDFARNLSLPKGYDAQAEVAAGGLPRPCDIGIFNGEHFVYVAAFGAFTSVAYDTPQQFKNKFGHLAYLLEGMAQLGSIESYHLTVTHDGGEEEGDYIFGMVSNTVSVGGLISLPADQVALDDGLLEVFLIRTPNNPLDFQAVIGALLKQNVEGAEGILSVHTSRLELKCDRAIPWTLDGEYGGDHQAAEVKVCRRAVEIVYGA
jgi:diacylglycerol kinase (ATP)